MGAGCIVISTNNYPTTLGMPTFVVSLKDVGNNTFDPLEQLVIMKLFFFRQQVGMGTHDNMYQISTTC